VLLRILKFVVKKVKNKNTPERVRFCTDRPLKRNVGAAPGRGVFFYPPFTRVLPAFGPCVSRYTPAFDPLFGRKPSALKGAKKEQGGV